MVDSIQYGGGEDLGVYSSWLGMEQTAKKHFGSAGLRESHGPRVLRSIVLTFPYRLSLGLFLDKDPSGRRGL